MADQNGLVVIESDDEDETDTGGENPEVARPEQTIDLENFQKKMKLLQEQLDLYKENEKDYEAKDEELKTAIKKLQGMLKKIVDQCGIYESVGEQFRMELDEKDKKIVHLREENETLKLKIEAMNVNYQDGSIIVLNVIGDDTEFADAEQTLQDQIDELKDHYNQLKKSIDCNKYNFKHQLERYAERDQLREQLAAMERINEELRAQVRQSKESENKWFQIVHSWEVEALKLKESFDEWASKMKKQVEELKTKSQLTESAMEIELDEALQKNSDLSSKCEQLKLKLQTSEQKHQSDFQEMERLKLELQNKTRDLIKQQILIKEKDELLREHHNRENRITQMLQKNSDLGSECEQLKLKLQTSEQKHQSDFQEIERLKLELENKMTDLIKQQIVNKEKDELLREHQNRENRITQMLRSKVCADVK